jgi:integrase
MDRHAATRRLRHLAEAADIQIARAHPHMLRHTYVTTMQVSGVALGASFGTFGERALPAVQRAALEQARSHGTPCTPRDLGCHHPCPVSLKMRH